MKKNSVFPAILIILTGIIVIGSFIAYGYFSYKNTPVYFNPRKKESAKKLYNSIMEADLENNYPKTPDEVMTLYLDINRLIYSDMIAHESLYGDVTLQMRKLFGPELIEKNDYETQLETIKTAVETLKELGINQLSYEQLPVIYNTIESKVCYIRAKQSYNNGEIFYWEFQIERVLPESYWKILRFDRTDENYNPIPWE